jgi:hypothetical protein
MNYESYCKSRLTPIFDALEGTNAIFLRVENSD